MNGASAYALEAFKVNSIDYLLKPVEPTHLNRAIAKLERVLGGMDARGDINALLGQVRLMLSRRDPEYLTRVASRVGGRVEFVEVAGVSHAYVKDKVTFAAAPTKHHLLDLTIAELEQRLPPRRWVRIHRSTMSARSWASATARSFPSTHSAAIPCRSRRRFFARPTSSSRRRRQASDSSLPLEGQRPVGPPPNWAF